MKQFEIGFSDDTRPVSITVEDQAAAERAARKYANVAYVRPVD